MGSGRDSDVERVAQTDVVGTAVSHFRIEAPLGAGAMGLVYRAIDTKLHRPVALKLLPAEAAGDATRRARLLREARAAAAVSHANIATIYEVGEDDGRIFIAMELIEGETLRERIIRARPPLPEALDTALQIARALARAHERGVVHRDLKPDNVMLSVDGVKVLDFGLAKRAVPPTGGDAESAELTTGGQVLGTPAYMAPEQISSTDVDARVDVFALGVILYEMLAGTRPFHGANVIELAVAILHEDPTPVTAHNADVEPALERLVTRCLAKKPADRYHSAAEVVAELARITGTPGSSTSSLRRDNVARSSRTLAVGAAVAAVLAAGAVGLWATTRGGSDGPDTDRDAARAVAVTDLPDPVTARPEALAMYRAAQTEFRAGGWRYFGLLRAIDVDPQFPAAHLIMAWVTSPFDIAASRGHLERARLGRDRLSERDRAYLRAIEPLILSEPADFETAAARLDETLASHPGDAELTLMRAEVESNREPADGEPPDAPLRRAIEIAGSAEQLDPEFVQPHALVAKARLTLGEVDVAASEAERCVDMSPVAAECWLVLLAVHAQRGACDLAERDARRFIASNPSNPRSYREAAHAAYARGRPAESVDQLLEQYVERSPEDQRNHMAVHYEIALAVLRGELGAAEQRAREALRTARASEQRAAAVRLAELLVEQGRADEAAAIAFTTLERAASVPGPTRIDDRSVAADTRWELIELARRGGALSADGAAARRETLLAEWSDRVLPLHRRALWPVAYAHSVVDEKSAKAALGALPGYEPLAIVQPTAALNADIGRTYLLAGNADDALPYLTRATSACAALADPIADTRAQLALGMAQEGAGDRDASCRAFAVVLSRWGAADTRSVTAELARERSAALDCPAPPAR